jgi:hypothetical protein
MPKNTFKKKALAYIEKFKTQENNYCLSCDSLIEELSEFFIVSRLSVKYRLLEVGLERKSQNLRIMTLYMKIQRIKMNL